ncbi:hypothetical protein QBC40DRAFT_329647 [Triangularia verruculosa]|uniref:Uncharacterized protein n=1 Tax=Triangularia verruculosa TaxID=2587418 RepID=A0AAN6XEQ7_9PEZI|nr:hypothetical protein QBC40DRAFT_329647 [Triangularia verruculosa]
MCDKAPESDTPFCAPEEGAQVQTGDSVKVIWSPRFFATSPTSRPRQIRIQADFFPSGTPLSRLNSTLGNGTEGFTSGVLNPSLGTFNWSILDSYLDEPDVSSLIAALSIAEPFTDSDGNGTVLEGNDRFPGPVVTIVRGPARPTSTNPVSGGAINTPPPRSSNNTGPNPIAIALPILFGFLTAITLACCMIYKRRHPSFKVGAMVAGWMGRSGRGGFGGLKSSGYGQGRSQRQRMGGGLSGKDIRVVTTDIQGLRMNAVNMMTGQSQQQARNVFREEVRRQERREGDGGVFRV